MVHFKKYKQRLTREGIHLFDRHSGTNILIDEIAVPPTQWALSPAYISMALTNACDLECNFCYAPKHAAKLEHDQVINWCVQASETGCLGVGFGGGEPTLFPGLSRLVHEISARTDLSISMTTHAHRLSSRVVDELAMHMHFIRVSMDGVDAVYESVRNRRFDDLKERLRDISSAMPFGINTVINSATLPTLDAVVDIAISYGARQLLLLPEISKGRTTLSPHEVQVLEEWINRNRNRIPLAASRLGSEGFDIPRLPTHAVSDAADQFMHIDASGCLKLCAFDSWGIKIDPSKPITSSISEMRRRMESGLRIMETRL